MNLLWPDFHDPTYRPGFRDRLSIHWQANLRMLGHPRDIAVFTVISFLPLALLLLLEASFPSFFASGSTSPAAISKELPSILLRVLVVAVIFLVLQHLAFVFAMNLTYVGHVRRTLGDRGIPVCRRCGQLLAPDRPESACPECGHRPMATTLDGLDSPKHGEASGHPSQDAATRHAQNGIRR